MGDRGVGHGVRRRRKQQNGRRIGKDESDGKSMRTVVPSLIGAANDSVAIRFLRKKDIFLFQLPAGYGSEIEKPKGSGV
jgi:hypothetical protein